MILKGGQSLNIGPYIGDIRSRVPDASNNNAGWGTFILDRLELPTDRSKKMQERTIAFLNAQEHSGAGFEADKTLRAFQLEYARRTMAHGAMSMPSSFELGCAFFSTSPRLLALTLLPEVDHLVSFSDFLEFVTADDAPDGDVAEAYELPEGVIYNVNSLEPADALLLGTETSSSFGFAAASMVRRLDELTVMMVLGEERPAGESEALARSIRKKGELNPGKAFLKNVDTSKDERLLLEKTELGRTVALVRFNLKERRMDVRMLLREFTNMFHVESDSVMTVPPSNPYYPTYSKSMQEKLDAVGSVWEIAKTMVLLPAYLAKRIDVVKQEVVDTALRSKARSSMKVRKALEKSPEEARILFRRIAAVRVQKPETERIAGRSFTPPQFQVAVDGYWRYYKEPTTQGHDENGEPVPGRTWVRAHTRWKDKEAGEPGPKIVYVKSSLAAARARLQCYLKKTLSRQAQPDGTRLNAGRGQNGEPKGMESQQEAPAAARAAATQAVGQVQTSVDGQVETALDGAGVEEGPAYLYVMRCPAHGRDIFKVGFSQRDPETRAQELSATTASPTHFLVVEAWAVVDGKAAEQAAHEALNAHRLNDRREFFKAPYRVLRKAIESSLTRWEIAS